MAEDEKVARYRLTRSVAQERVRATVANTSMLRWTQHIQERMHERGIEDVDVLRILRTGDVEEDPVSGTNEGEWKVKLTRKLSTGRVAGVVVVMLPDGTLRLATTEWEDRR